MMRKSPAYFFVILVVVILIFVCNNCGELPSDAPPPLVGSLKVVALIDTTQVDCMMVTIDTDSMGQQPNPFLLHDVFAGKHFVAVAKEDPQTTIDYTCSPRLVTVNENDTTEVRLELTKTAPSFELKNLRNEDIILDNYRDKVVLLIFYDHT
jgi:hypothetical protein